MVTGPYRAMVLLLFDSSRPVGVSTQMLVRPLDFSFASRRDYKRLSSVQV